MVAVSDGDTITILDDAKTQHKIRFAGIDAPEKGQPFGERSKQNLSALVFQKRVEARCHKKDRYGREVCAVFVSLRDVGLEQIRAGMAWWYREYAARADDAGSARVSRRGRGCEVATGRIVEGREASAAVGVASRDTSSMSPRHTAAENRSSSSRGHSLLRTFNEAAA